MAIADHVCVVHEGAIVAQGTSDSLQPEEQLQRAYFSCAKEHGTRSGLGFTPQPERGSTTLYR
jgi:ABC-type Na+ transport system ATPase subunit NatA